MANWIELMSFGARGVLVVLFILSIWSVGIMFDRKRVFNAEVGQAKPNEAKKMIQNKNWDLLRSWAENNPSYVGGVVHAALNAESSDSESVDRAVQSYLADEKLKLEKGLNVLATLGANAPFIGLFGTVLGIIQSFGILSSTQGSGMNAVMLGLAEALLSTAVGLFVAIPAVVSYNYFANRMRTINLEAQSVRDLYVSKMSGSKAGSR
jgi:biopolymer transport protein ExbB